MTYKKFTITIFFIILIFTQNIFTCAHAQIDSAQIENFNIELLNAKFKQSNVAKLSIKANKVNFNEGLINLLSIKTFGFQNKDIILDELSITLTNIAFLPEHLLSQQELILKKPVKTSAYILVSEKTLNATLNQPKILNKLSNITKAKIKKFGIEVSGGLISFIEPRARLLENNNIEIQMKAAFSNLVAFPVSYRARLSIDNSKLILTSPVINTSGISLPNDIAIILNSKLSTLLDIDKKLKEDADVKITSIKIEPGKQIFISADAIIRKLKFSKKKKK